MSRSQPTLQNPAVRFFDWSAKQGQIRYYDKEAKENVDVKMPFRFLVLDQLSQIGGGKKVGQGKNKEFIGYYSNAVRKFDINKEKFIVKDKNGVVGEGSYQEVKAITGAKLVAGLYIAFFDDDKKLQIGHLKLHGSAMGAWFEFSKGKNVEQGVITVAKGEEERDEDDKVYYLPAYSQSNGLTDETEAAAIELDEQLQKYLTVYFNKAQDAEEEFTGNGKAQAASASGPSFDDIADVASPDDFGPDPDDSDPIPF
jgi:hypothetical protein